MVQKKNKILITVKDDRSYNSNSYLFLLPFWRPGPLLQQRSSGLSPIRYHTIEPFSAQVL